MEIALASTLTTGTFVNTAYYLFSGRTRRGKAGRLRVVYTNSTVLKGAAEHFRARECHALLWVSTADGMGTGCTELDGGFSVDDNAAGAEMAEYGYESDSDLEDYDELGEAYDASPGVSEVKNSFCFWKLWQISDNSLDSLASRIRLSPRLPLDSFVLRRPLEASDTTCSYPTWLQRRMCV